MKHRRVSAGGGDRGEWLARMSDSDDEASDRGWDLVIV